MDKFLEKYNLPKLNEEEAESLNRPVTPDEIETVFKKLLRCKRLGQDGFTGEFYTAIKGVLIPITTGYFKKFKNMEDSQTLFKKPASS